MGWTYWRKISDKNYWYTEDFDNEGPACYELGVGHSSTRVSIKYVGETGNEKQRISQYARHGSHLSKEIDDYLKRGFNLYYRAVGMSSKRAAVQMQDRMLYKYKYDWNIHHNIEDDD